MYAEAHQTPGVPELAARARAHYVTWCRILRFDGDLSSARTEEALRELLLPPLPFRGAWGQARQSAATTSVPCLIARFASSSTATSAPPIRCAERSRSSYRSRTES